MNSVKLFIGREKLNRFALPIVLTLLFVLYYAFGLFVQDFFVASETGKNAVGMLLAYSTMAFLGILLFILLTICKNDLRKSKSIYVVLNVFAISITIVYLMLASQIITEYFNKICDKLEMIFSYAGQTKFSKNTTLLNTLIMIKVAASTIALFVAACLLSLVILKSSFTYSVKEQECAFSYTKPLLKNENLGFLYFALS